MLRNCVTGSYARCGWDKNSNPNQKRSRQSLPEKKPGPKENFGPGFLFPASVREGYSCLQHCYFCRRHFPAAASLAEAKGNRTLPCPHAFFDSLCAAIFCAIIVLHKETAKPGNGFL